MSTPKTTRNCDDFGLCQYQFKGHAPCAGVCAKLLNQALDAAGQAPALPPVAMPAAHTVRVTPGKHFPFAPGVIDAPGKPYHWRWTDALGAIVFVALAGYLVRYWQ